MSTITFTVYLESIISLHNLYITAYMKLFAYRMLSFDLQSKWLEACN